MPTDDEIIRLPIGLDFGPASADVAEEQARLATAFNKIPGMQGLDFPTIRSVVNNPGFGDLATFRGQYPQAGKALDRYSRFASTGQTDEQRTASTRAEAKQRQEELTQKRADLRKADDLRRQRRQAEQEEVRAIRARVMSLSAMGVFAAGGGTGHLRYSLAETGYHLLAGGKLGDTTLGAMLGGRRRASAPAPAVRAATSAVGSAVGTTATADLTSTVEAGAAGSAVGAGITAAMTSAFWPALAVAAVAGVVNAGSAIEASVWTSRYQLANAISGATGQKLYGDILSVAQNTIQSPTMVAGVATQLGGMGVKGPDVVPNTETALDLTRIEPAIPQATANQLVGTLSAQGGMTPQQIGTTLDTLRLTSDATGISLEKMTTNLLEFEKATNGTRVDLKSLADSLAFQSLVGPGVNTLAATAPAVNATGAQAMQMAGFLNMSQTSFAQLQKNPAALQQAILGKLRQTTAGMPRQNAVNQMEAINQQFGFFNTAGWNAQQQATFFTTGSTPAQQAALAKKAVQIRQAAQGASQPDFQNTGTQAANRETSIADKIANAALTHALQAANTGMGPGGISSAQMVAGAAGGMAGGLLGGVFLGLPGLVAGTGAGALMGSHAAPVAGAVGNAAGDAFHRMTTAPGLGMHQHLGGPFTGETSDQVTQTLATIRDTDKQLYDWLQRHEDLFTFTAAQKAVLAGGSPTSVQSGTGAAGGKHPGASSPLPPGGGGGGGPTWTGATAGPGSYALAASGRPGEAPMKVSGALLGDYLTAAGGDQNLLKMMLVQGARESSFNPNATAPDGGQGIAQFMPGTIASLNARKDSPFYGKTFNPYDPAQATMLQAFYDKILLAQEGGNVQNAFRDYNGSGPAANTYGAQAYGAYQTVRVVVEDKTTGGVKAHATVSHDRTPPGHTGTNPPAFIKHGGRR